MDFMSGLEKFGFDTGSMGDLFAEDESKTSRIKKQQRPGRTPLSVFAYLILS